MPGLAWSFSCCGIPPCCGIRRCRRSPRTPPRRSSTPRLSPSSPVGTQEMSTCSTRRPAWHPGGRRTWPACPRPTSGSPATIRGATTASATENCWPRRACPSRYITRRRWCTVTSATRASFPPPQPGWIGGSRRCAMRWIGEHQAYGGRMMEPPLARPGIDPTFKALLDAFTMTFNADDGVELARARLSQLKVPEEMLPPLRIENRTISYGDLTDIPVRIYWPPDSEAPPPVVVFFHGGGFALGDLDTHDPVARMHVLGAEAIVVSVDYRLAPENPFPAGVNDSWAALQWVGEHAAELGGDPARIAVAGDSAGANLAAGMAQLARDSADSADGVGLNLAFQLLWYPTTAADLSLPSFTENADGPILDHDVIDAFLGWYIPGVDIS